MTRPFIVAAVAVLAVTAACEATGSSPDTTVSSGALEANATIDYVVDGDTVDVVIDGREERVRLIGIDTPETKQPDTADRVLRPGGHGVHRVAPPRRHPGPRSSATP